MKERIKQINTNQKKNKQGTLPGKKTKNKKQNKKTKQKTKNKQKPQGDG